MTERDGGSGATRRSFLTKAAGLAAVAGTSLVETGAAVAKGYDNPAVENEAQREAFWGAYQGGIITPQ